MYHIYCLFGLIILANICFIVVVTPVAGKFFLIFPIFYIMNKLSKYDFIIDDDNR